MESRKLFGIGIVLFFTMGVFFVSPGSLFARTLTLKVSHQFAAGDVRDNMARVFGDMVSEKTNGQIKFRYYPASSLYKAKEQ